MSPRPRRGAVTTGDVVPTNSIIASAARMRFDAGWRKAGSAQGWAQEAWSYYDLIGEVKFAARWLGNAMSRAKLMINDRAPDGETGDPTDNQAAQDVLAALGNTSAILGEFGPQLTVPGEAYLVGEDDGSGRFAWSVVSTEELSARSGKVWIDTGDGKREVDQERSLIVRVWRPHPRRRAWADSPIRSALPTLRKLVGYDQHTFATLDSRLAGAGLLILPSEMTFPTPLDSPVNHEDPFMAVLTEAMITPIKDRGAASAVVPIVIRAPAEAIKAAQLLRFDQPLTESVVKLEEAAVRRLAVAMDFPPEILLGLGDANHWNGAVINEAAVTIHVKPAIDLVIDAITIGYLEPALAAMGLDPALFALTADTNALTQRPDRTDPATVGFDRGLLSGETWRAASGFDEADAPEDDELARFRLLEVLKIVPAAAAAVVPCLDLGACQVTANELAAPAGPGAPAITAPTATGDVLPAGSDSTPVSTSPPDSGASAGSTAALLAACEMAVWRALELAGNRSRTRAARPSLEGIPRHEVYLHLPAPPRERIPALLEGAWSAVPDIAARYPGLNEAELVRRLDTYAAGLLASGRRHDPATFAQALVAVPSSSPGSGASTGRAGR